MLRPDKIEKFFESWEYLNRLEIVHYKELPHFEQCLSVQVVKENPATHSVDDNEELNTHVQVWLEFGEVYFDDKDRRLRSMHDPDLDCGADTFEEAIIELARLCRNKGLVEHVYRTVTDEEIDWLEKQMKPHK